MSTARDVGLPDRSGSWFAKRARNAARRSSLIAGVGSLAFLATVIALAIVPRQRQAEARAIASLLVQRRDTAPALTARDSAREILDAVEAELSNARRRSIRPPSPPIDTLPPALIARRDSLTRADAALTAMIDRVQNVPLPGTYRTLGEMPELASDGRARILLDSLTDIEREREAFGAVGGVDPVFVALTARATAIGRAIQEIAESRRAAGRQELARLRPPRPPPPVVSPLADTLPLVRRRAAVVATFEALTRELERIRLHNADINERAAAARTATNIVIPPVAMLAAALVVGAGAGFGTALAIEVRRSRVADADEVEALTGLRVLAVVGPKARQPDRSRRSVDREMSPLMDPGAEAYRLVYLYLTGSESRAPLATVTGGDRRVTAAIAVNIAAAAAYDARTTLVVDGELSANLAASLLRVRRTPGLVDILAGSADWTEVIVPAVIGRERALDVIPSGVDAIPRHELKLTPLRAHLERIARRYDFVVVVMPPPSLLPGAEPILPVADVIYCVVRGVTPLLDLATSLDILRGSGARVRGIVVWDGQSPEIDHERERTAPPSDASLPLSAAPRDR